MYFKTAVFPNPLKFLFNKTLTFIHFTKPNPPESRSRILFPVTLSVFIVFYQANQCKNQPPYSKSKTNVLVIRNFRFPVW